MGTIAKMFGVGFLIVALLGFGNGLIDCTDYTQGDEGVCTNIIAKNPIGFFDIILGFFSLIFSIILLKRK